MKNRQHMTKTIAVMVCLTLIVTAFTLGGFTGASIASAEIAPPAYDPSPAIQVARKTAQSVVGVSSYTQTWDRTQGQKDTLFSQGSGVVIAKGGYILTNYHVIEDCTSFKLLLSDGTEIPAKIIGVDSSTDLAVLQAEERADELIPVEIASTSDLPVGSTIIAIGNPGGDVLANTVTQGIVSALERNVRASNTSRAIKYIQHDAAINNGNSGGGLFNIHGQLVGINTLKYSGSTYSTVSYEGLGFAIPVDTAFPIAQDLIEFGEVQRPQMGITCTSLYGPDDPMPDYAPSGVVVVTVNADSPALAADMRPFDCITEIDGVRVKDLTELTTELDQHKDGDKVKVKVVRYANPSAVYNMSELFYANSGGMNDGMQGGQRPRNVFGYGYGYANGGANSFETIELEITLRILGKNK